MTNVYRCKGDIGRVQHIAWHRRVEVTMRYAAPGDQDILDPVRDPIR